MFMITSHEWLNPTRATGLAAYGTASACCGITWIRMKARRKPSRLAAVLMLIESALLLDIAFDWRWKLHDALADSARRMNEYAVRGVPQRVTLALLGLLLLFALLATRRSFPGRMSAQLAVSGVLLSLVVWCVEVVSLHSVDHVLYSLSGRLMVVGLLWILSCAMTSIGISLDS